MEVNFRWFAITAIAPLAWGSTYFVTRHFLPPDYPLYGAVIRALPAGVVLLAIVRERPRGSWWWKSAVLGVLNVGAFFTLIYAAAQLLPSGLAATLMAMSPLTMLLLAWPLLDERPRLVSLFGAAIGIAGVCIMLGGGRGSVNGLGILASLVAMTMSSTGYLLAKRWGSEVRILSLTAWQLIAGGLCILPIAIVVEGRFPSLDGPAVVGFAYVTVVATAVAFCVWFAGLRRLSAGAVGLIGLLNPVMGVLLGAVLGAEPFGWPQGIGSALVLCGIVAGQPRSVRTRPPGTGIVRAISPRRWSGRRRRVSRR
ncbi:MAG TPA: DMT family transporter [Lacisediminihabitans sp.]|uniref:DMT family transporter n=1 Tax=Lacisediminihabitans sp. TaxID=2787631 RepID=UPI002EDA54A5